jgi:hypothetical protein
LIALADERDLDGAASSNVSEQESAPPAFERPIDDPQMNQTLLRRRMVEIQVLPVLDREDRPPRVLNEKRDEDREPCTDQGDREADPVRAATLHQWPRRGQGR